MRRAPRDRVKVPLHGSVSIERQNMRSDMFNNFNNVIEFNVRYILIVESCSLHCLM